MGKYNIDREFFPFSVFKPPINKPFLALASFFMRPPADIWWDKELDVSRHEIESYDGAKIECFIFSPKLLDAKAPCLIYFHGGGFVLKAAGYHYKNAMQYAKSVGCKVVFVNYRLAPKNPHPVFFEDCYFACRWVVGNADTLGIDAARIGVGGDSAGGTLAVGVCLMALDRGWSFKPVFQMLPYPFLDARNDSESCRKYTDTPMWNSTLSSKIARFTKVDRDDPSCVYYSPLEAKSVVGLPTAYIEVAELDCLRDDGLLYAQRLRELGIDVTLNETLGTMHGFDIVSGAKKTAAAIAARIEFMKSRFCL